MPILNVNNADFYYEIHGNGQPVVLISGYSCDHLAWLPILAGLSKHFQVILFDNRAIGRTVDKGIPLSVELMAQDVIDLAQQLQLNKPHIIGHSMGGTIAQTIAGLYPGEISKVCILASSVKWRPAMLGGLESLLTMRKQNIDFDMLFASTLPWIFGNEFLTNAKALTELKKATIENPYPQSLPDQTRQFRVLEQFNGEKYLSRIQAPTLITYGCQDLLSLPYESAYMAKQIPCATLTEFDSGHGMMLEVPKHLTETLIKFLNVDQV